MTVINTSYSSIEEAWADNYLAPSLQKKQKKKKSSVQSDPICDLYEMGNNTYEESDIVSYANKFYDKHEKAKFQKSRMHEREKLPKVVDIDVSDELGAMDYGPVREKKVQFSVEDEEEQTVSKDEIKRILDESDDEEYIKTNPRDKILYDTKEYYDDEENDFNQKNKSFSYFDIVLYIISGIILIFMMEQFVKIGVMMR